MTGTVPVTPAPTVTGSGVLATAVRERLREAGAGAVDVLVTDGWQDPTADAPPGPVRLPVHTELGTVVIGPAEIAGHPGCPTCVELRTGRARRDGRHREQVLRRYGTLLTDRPSRWLTALAAGTVAALVEAEVTALSTDPASARTHRATVHVDLEHLTVTRHRFLPEPLCPRCGDLPDDDAAAIALVPRPKPDPRTYRIRPVGHRRDELVDLYVDAEHGLVRSLHRDTQGGLVIAGAMTPMRSHDGVEPGVGRSRSYRESELTAILEAIERYGGTEPGGRRTRVEGSFTGLGGRALDPRTLGVHPAESYAAADFPYRPFDPDARYRWVWGWSFAREAPILVPETMAYYHLGTAGPTRAFSYEISNGCALGGCREEAILYGLLEAVERDAFLMTWYHRRSAPRIDLATAADRDLPMQAAAITAETGYRVLVFDTTAEHGVPSVWAMAVDPDGDPTRPACVSAAGAHLSLERAVLNALSELGPILADLVRRYPEESDRAARLAADAALCESMPDHSLLYAHPDAFARLAFLDTAEVPTGPTRALGVDDPREAAFRHDDLTADLREVVTRYVAAGQDVVVVDQTTPEHEAGGFRCVKVLVPGLVPMTFGHRFRRTEGLPRLDGAADPHTHPHPFP